MLQKSAWQAGGWRIDVEGLIDSELELCVNSFTEPTAIKCGFLELERHADVSIGFRHRGSEAHISVYATRV